VPAYEEADGLGEAVENKEINKLRMKPVAVGVW
jgi:hypothetical protein